VYAQIPGSAAAPTAGLHFTDRVFEALRDKGISWVYVTLHVGLGTFEPVREDDIRAHKMHSEYIEISSEVADKINRVKRAGGRIVAVGTTAVRTLETVATDDGFVRPFSGETDLFIYPGYRFKVVDALITNFHLPKSSLLMLASAFWNREKLLRAYDIAKAKGYRFFSFGDAMLIL
jgi:S-adenosylmethionine:tRNA ribosyltransferase-isomerase